VRRPTVYLVAGPGWSTESRAERSAKCHYKNVLSSLPHVKYLSIEEAVSGSERTLIGRAGGEELVIQEFLGSKKCLNIT
jgi:hypothetical protein